MIIDTTIQEYLTLVKKKKNLSTTIKNEKEYLDMNKNLLLEFVFILFSIGFIYRILEFRSLYKNVDHYLIENGLGKIFDLFGKDTFTQDLLLIENTKLLNLVYSYDYLSFLFLIFMPVLFILSILKWKNTLSFKDATKTSNSLQYIFNTLTVACFLFSLFIVVVNYFGDGAPIYLIELTKGLLVEQTVIVNALYQMPIFYFGCILSLFLFLFTFFFSSFNFIAIYLRKKNRQILNCNLDDLTQKEVLILKQIKDLKLKIRGNKVHLNNAIYLLEHSKDENEKSEIRLLMNEFFKDKEQIELLKLMVNFNIKDINQNNKIINE